jgi:hypothetical protein
MNAAAILLAVALAHPCHAPEHHALDFWVGEWNVKDTRSGTPVGTSKIESILDGCVVLENWTGGRGGSGKSFNTYDEATKQWKQSWVDSSGSAYDFLGEAFPGRLVYMRKVVDAAGKTSTNRLTFSKNDDGSVRQLSEQSADGKTWTTGYDFTYVKR